MGNEIIWEKQDIFRSLAQTFAKKIFDKLDKNLNPSVFLIGILDEEKDKWEIKSFNPLNDNYPNKIFKNIKEITKKIENLDERNYGYGFSRDWYIGIDVDYIYIKEAILNIISKNDAEYGVRTFCSLPTLINNYLVFVILQVDLTAYNSHYMLRKKIKDNILMSRSLIESTINEYLSLCITVLKEFNPIKNITIFNRNPSDIIRSGGRDFMDTPIVEVNIEGYDLFEACSVISSLMYEGSPATGKIVISKADHQNIEQLLLFKTPINFHDYRAVRKILEMSSNENCLLSDSYEIYGLGKLDNKYDENKEDLFIINFPDQFKWELIHADKLLMNVNYGNPRLPKGKIDKKKFLEDICRIFHDVTPEDVELLWKLIMEVIKQEKGTIIVISENAKTEAQRLKNQGSLIKPCLLDPKLIKMVTSIDGAILISQKGICYSIGVILDGLATDEANSTRGARYNSAIRYQKSSKCPCLLVIVSDDGLVDIVPNLKPRIHHFIIEDAIFNLINLTEKDEKKFNNILRSLHKYRFYLSKEECDEINSIIHEFTEERGFFCCIGDDFIPNKSLNDSYFIKENKKENDKNGNT